MSVGLAIHAATFVPGMFWGRDREEREIRELMDKDRGE